MKYIEHSEDATKIVLSTVCTNLLALLGRGFNHILVIGQLTHQIKLTSSNPHNSRTQNQDHHFQQSAVNLTIIVDISTGNAGTN